MSELAQRRWRVIVWVVRLTVYPVLALLVSLVLYFFYGNWFPWSQR